MTTGEWLSGMSSAEEGSTMLTVVAELEGTYPVLTPVESFEVNIREDVFIANLDIIAITANMDTDTYDCDLEQDVFTANIDDIKLDGDL